MWSCGAHGLSTPTIIVFWRKGYRLLCTKMKHSYVVVQRTLYVIDSFIKYKYDCMRRFLNRLHAKLSSKFVSFRF